MDYLAFEKPIEELIIKLEQAKELGKDESIDISNTIADLEKQIYTMMVFIGALGKRSFRI